MFEVCAALGVAAALPQGVLAQQAGQSSAMPAAAPAARGADQLEEIVVTAERRETSIQKTALQVSAISGEALQRQPMTDLVQLGQSQPEIIFNDRFGVLQTTIRGVGGDDASLGSDSRVAFHVDGVYIARGAAQHAGLYDVDRMEVVQGPQGTLYGRNATGGAVNVITAAPTDELSGYVNETVGTYSLFKTDAAINIPVDSNLALRFATEIIDQDGFGRNVYLNQDVNNQHSKAVRGRARWRDDSGLQIDLIADYYDRNDNAYGVHNAGYIQTPVTPTPPAFETSSATLLPTDLQDTSSDVLSTYHDDSYGVTLIGRYALTDHLEIRSTSGYRSNNYIQEGDADATNTLGLIGSSSEVSKTFSEEFQLNGQWDRTKFTTGLYGFGEDLQSAVNLAASTADFPLFNVLAGMAHLTLPPPTKYFPLTFTDSHLHTRSEAVFGQVTQNITDNFSITLGGRYSRETKAVLRGAQGLFAGSVPQYTSLTGYFVPQSLYQPEQRTTWGKFTPRVTLQYDFSPDAMIYATYAQGFKSGAYGLADLNPPARPEVLNDYEGGLKTSWFNRRLQANISGFYYRYNDIQVTVLQGLALITENAASARVYGSQLNLAGEVTRHLRIGLDALVMHSEFNTFLTADPNRPYLGVLDLAGKQLTQAPPYRATLSADYTVQVADRDLDFHVQATATDKYYLSPFNLPQVSVGAHTNLDASVRYFIRDGLTASLWGNNLTNKQVPLFVNTTQASTGNLTSAEYSAPRTFGGALSYHW